MNHTPPIDEQHLAEGDLVRYLDEEMPTSERGEAAAHLIGCGVCRELADSLRADRSRFTTLLGDLAVPSPDPARRLATLAAVERAAARHSPMNPAARRDSLLRVAAAATLLFASAFAFSPVRGALADIWSAIGGQVDRFAAVDEAREVERIPLAGATVGFIPSSESFVLEITNPQESGVLVLGVSPGVGVTAAAVDDQETVNLVVLPDGMRIENSPAAVGDYAVSLPLNLREVRIRIADQPDRLLLMSELSSTWVSVIELRQPNVSADDRP